MGHSISNTELTPVHAHLSIVTAAQG